jgi:hypothetical protein
LKVTNNSTAPQGIRTLSGLVYIPPGATREVAMSSSQADLARRLTFLAVEGEPEAAPADDPQRVQDDGNPRPEVASSFLSGPRGAIVLVVVVLVAIVLAFIVSGA